MGEIEIKKQIKTSGASVKKNHSLVLNFIGFYCVGKLTEPPIESGKTVILALYNGDVYVETQSAVYEGETITFTTTKTYTNANVMIWDDLINLTPISEVEEVK